MENELTYCIICVAGVVATGLIVSLAIHVHGPGAIEALAMASTTTIEALRPGDPGFISAPPDGILATTVVEVVSSTYAEVITYQIHHLLEASGVNLHIAQTVAYLFM